MDEKKTQARYHLFESLNKTLSESYSLCINFGPEDVIIIFECGLLVSILC